MDIVAEYRPTHQIEQDRERQLCYIPDPKAVSVSQNKPPTYINRLANGIDIITNLPRQQTLRFAGKRKSPMSLIIYPRRH